MEVRSLDFAYGRQPVLREISLTFPEGSFISILGPNGSGKSTLVKLLLGLLTPDQGDILIAGRPLGEYKPLERARLLAYVPQSLQPDFEFSVEEMVAMGRYPYIKRFADMSAQDHAIVSEAMAITDTLRLKDQIITMISGGEAQRVSLARAMAQQTPWLLLDEPVNHLDVSHQVGILKSLKAMTPQRTVIAVMHDLNLARDFSDYVILLQEGRVVKQGKPGQCIDPDVLSEIYHLDFLKTWTADGDLQYLFPRTK